MYKLTVNRYHHYGVDSTTSSMADPGLARATKAIHERRKFVSINGLLVVAYNRTKKSLRA